jgi:hypothetical protein
LLQHRAAQVATHGGEPIGHRRDRQSGSAREIVVADAFARARSDQNISESSACRRPRTASRRVVAIVQRAYHSCS